MISRLRQFALFWWNVPVGDAWEFAVSGIIVLGAFPTRSATRPWWLQ